MSTSASAAKAGIAMRAAAAGFLALHLVLGWLIRFPGLRIGEDDASYLLLGRALSRLGYASIWLAGSPPHGQYPPLYPALLAVSGAAAPGGVGTGILLNLLLSTAALAVFTLLVWRWSPIAGLGALAVAAVNPLLLRQAGSISSEPMFMLAMLVALWCAVDKPGRWPLAALAAIVAALTRGIGVAVVLGLLIYWVSGRRWRPAITLALAASLTVGIWLVRSATAPQQLAGQSYVGDALLRRKPPEAAPAPAASVPAPPSPTLGIVGGLARRVAINTREYLTGTIPTVLIVPTLPGTVVDNVVVACLLVALGLMGIRSMIRWTVLVPLVLAAYLGILLVWPYVVWRFLAPVLPFMAVVLLEGARKFGERLGPGSARLAIVIVSGALVLFSLAKDRQRVLYWSACDRRDPYRSPGCFTAVQIAFLETLADAARLAPPAATLLAPKVSAVYYLTGHTTVDDVFAASLSSDQLAEYLLRNQVDFALISRVHSTMGPIGAGIRARCTDWRLLVDRAALGSVLLRRGTPTDTIPTACESLGRIALTNP